MFEFDQNQTALEFDSDLSEVDNCIGNWQTIRRHARKPEQLEPNRQQRHFWRQSGPSRVRLFGHYLQRRRAGTGAVCN